MGSAFREAQSMVSGAGNISGSVAPSMARHACASVWAEPCHLASSASTTSVAVDAPAPQPLQGAGGGVGVAVECDQARLRAQPGQDQARVTAAAKGGVHIDALRVRTLGRIPQSLNGLVQQDGAMLQR